MDGSDEWKQCRDFPSGLGWIESGLAGKQQRT